MKVLISKAFQPTFIESVYWVDGGHTTWQKANDSSTELYILLIADA